MAGLYYRRTEWVWPAPAPGSNVEMARSMLGGVESGLYHLPGAPSESLHAAVSTQAIVQALRGHA